MEKKYILGEEQRQLNCLKYQSLGRPVFEMPPMKLRMIWDSFLLLTTFDSEKLMSSTGERARAASYHLTQGFVISSSPQRQCWGGLGTILFRGKPACFKPDEFPEPVYCLATYSLWQKGGQVACVQEPGEAGLIFTRMWTFSCMWPWNKSLSCC